MKGESNRYGLYPANELAGISPASFLKYNSEKRQNNLIARRELQNLRATPIAFESLGVRSMAIFVETDDLKILIDPSVALGPKRYGLPLHPLEIDPRRNINRS